MADPVTALSMAMNNDMLALRSVSQNLANISTAGYKSEVPFTTSFQNTLDRSNNVMSANPSLFSDGGGPSVDVVRDLRQGAVQVSNNPFDLALQGDGFFEVDTAEGTRYTRRGALMLDGQGRLSLVSGEVLRGESGAIFLNSGVFSVNADGVVRQNEVDVDRLRLVNFENPQNLAYMGEGLFSTGANNALAAADFEGQVMQGYTEISNVNSASEIIKLIELTRHFETTHQVLKGYDGMLDQAINVLGDL